MLILAPAWGWVVVANVLLGVNQGLTWSTTVIMKIDLVGPARRGLATGLNEAAGYGAVAFTALVTGFIAAAVGPRPAPFLVGLDARGTRPRGCRSSSCARPAGTSARERMLDRPAPPRRGATCSGGRPLRDRQPLGRFPGRTRQQPQRRYGLGPAPALLRVSGLRSGRDRRPRRDVSGGLGRWPRS